MKKLAITDACIFIDLLDLKLIRQFFSLPLEIHTTIDVLNELNSGQEETLMVYASVGKLIAHNLTSDDRLQVLSTNYPKALSAEDKTVLFIAEREQAVILSSDKAVRKYANDKAIEYHGILWIIDQLVGFSIITTKQGKEYLETLFVLNVIYQSNQEISLEFEKRIRKWG